MALIFETSRCSLCGGELDRPFLSTSGCAFPETHRLWQYCDAPLHIDCLQDWPDRIEFCSAYYRQRLDQYAREGWYVLATGDGWFCGKTSPYPGTIFAAGDGDLVEIRVEDWPIRFLAHISRWSEFIRGDWHDSASNLHSYAFARAQIVIAEAKTLIPDTQALYKLIAHHASSKTMEC